MPKAPYALRTVQIMPGPDLQGGRQAGRHSENRTRARTEWSWPARRGRWQIVLCVFLAYRSRARREGAEVENEN